MTPKLIISTIIILLVSGFLCSTCSTDLLEVRINKTITFVEYLSKEKIYIGLSEKYTELLENHFDEAADKIKSESLSTLSKKEKEFLTNYIELVQKPSKEHIKWVMAQVEEGDYRHALDFMDYIKAIANRINSDNENVMNFNYLLFMAANLKGHQITEYPVEELDAIFSDTIDIVFPKASPKELLFTLLCLSRTWDGLSYTSLKKNIDIFIEAHRDVLKPEEIDLFIKFKEGRELTGKDDDIIERIMKSDNI